MVSPARVGRVVLVSLLATFVVGAARAAEAPGPALGPAAIPKERRLALVIGNSAYQAAPLRNPVNDAADFAAALTSTGFEVTRLENANLREMRTALRDFGDRLKKQGGIGLFYFAGHGMQVRGKNYLIPVAAQIEREDEVEFESLDANLVLEKLDSAGNRFNIVILDACRNNPFARSFRASTQGLAQMDAPAGAVVAFATSPGSVASDGAGRNGLYTQHLVEEVRVPGLKIEEVFKRVRAGVRRDSTGKQTPWESTSLEGDFYFTPVDTGALEAMRQKQEQERLENAVRLAIAQERERLRQEYAQLQANAPSAAPAAATDARPTVAAAAPLPSDARPTLVSSGPTTPPPPKAAPASAVSTSLPSGIGAELQSMQDANTAAVQSMVPVPAYPLELAPSQEDKSGVPAPFDVATVAPTLAPPAATVVVGTRSVGKVAAPQFTAGDEWEFVRVTSYAGGRPSAPIPTFDKLMVTDVKGDTLTLSHVTYDPPRWTPSTEVFRSVSANLESLFDPDDARSGRRRALAFPLDVGESWSYKYEHEPSTGGKMSDTFNAKVVAWEQVTVQAGTFWALKVEQLGWATDLSPGASSMERSRRVDFTLWYSPDAKYIVKSVYQIYGAFGAASTPLSTSTVQLVRYRSAGSTLPAAASANR